jgi:predicted metal-dependent RNase
MSFLHTLKKEERRILREVVKRVHLKHHPEQFCTDREADKVISVIGPETVDIVKNRG